MSRFLLALSNTVRVMYLLMMRNHVLVNVSLDQSWEKSFDILNASEWQYRYSSYLNVNHISLDVRIKFCKVLFMGVSGSFVCCCGFRLQSYVQ